MKTQTIRTLPDVGIASRQAFAPYNIGPLCADATDAISLELSG
jgi:hypothetical protein